jgi:AmiR/NasT family two-component response regulator
MLSGLLKELPMDEKQLVVLYGDTLLIDGVEASLTERNGLDVVRVDKTIANVAQHLKTIAPDLVIFDIDTPVIELSKLIVPLLHKQPAVPFICLDAQHSEVVTLACEQHPSHSTNDLVDIIRKQLPLPEQHEEELGID